MTAKENKQDQIIRLGTSSVAHCRHLMTPATSITFPLSEEVKEQVGFMGQALKEISGGHSKPLYLAGNQFPHIVFAIGTLNVPGDQAYVMLNPKIVESSKEKHASGSINCFSFPNERFYNIYAQNITIEYFTPEGEQKRKEFTGDAAKSAQLMMGILAGKLPYDLIDKKELEQHVRDVANNQSVLVDASKRLTTTHHSYLRDGRKAELDKKDQTATEFSGKDASDVKRYLSLRNLFPVRDAAAELGGRSR